MRPAVPLLLLATLGWAIAPASAAPQRNEWPRERPPAPLPARDVTFPPYEFRTLDNGLQVIAVPHHETPAVSLRLIVRAGAAQDPEGKSGLAMLAAALLDQGTTSRNAETIATTIDSIGGAMGTGAGTDLTYVNAAVMRDSLDVALDLVAEVAMHPAFAQEEIDRQKQQMLSALQVSNQDPDYIAGVVFDRLVYGFHAYGRPQAGTAESIAAIARPDLQAFHKTWFGANNAILAIVGDVQPEEAFAGAERAFGKWARVEIPEAESVGPPPPARRLIVVDRPGAVQTEIRVGNVALPRKHPDFLALDLAMKILGGEGGNRLHRVLRSQRGLTYGASADVYALRDTGDLMADTDTRSETTAEALRLIVDEIWRLQREPVHPRELADAQAYLTGSFPLTIETPGGIALQILNAVFYELDLAELQTFRQRVNRITPEDIQRVARKYLHPDRLSIVLVGDASVFEKDLRAAGFENSERIPLAELDLSAADLRRPAAPARRYSPIGWAPPLDPAAGQAERQDVRTLVTEAIQAKGGLEKLRSIRTVKAESTTWIDGPGGRIEIPTTTYIRYPDAFRVDARTPAGRVTQLLVGGSYWVEDGRGAREAPAPVAAEMLSAVYRDTITLLPKLATTDVRMTPAAVRLQGREMPALEITNPGGTPLTLIFDPDTRLVAGQRYTLESPSGPVAAEELFSDYRDVNGLKVAFRTVLQRAGAPRVERVVTRFTYNVPLDPALFATPGERGTVPADDFFTARAL